MDYITKNKVQISYMDFRGLCVRWAFIGGTPFCFSSNEFWDKGHS